MPRRDPDEDDDTPPPPKRKRRREDDDERPAKKKGMSQGLIIGLVVGSVLLASCLGGGILLVAGFFRSVDKEIQDEKRTAASKEVAKELALPTREELLAKVKGKTPDEVKEMLGVPFETSGTGPNATWSYKKIAKDGVTGKADDFTHIIFRSGVVDRL